MAIAYVAAGAGASGAANCTPALPAGIVSGNLLIALVENANQQPTIGAQNGGAWAQIGTLSGTGAAGGTTAAGLAVYWDRYNGTQTAPNFTDGGGDHVGARIYGFSGVKSTGNPWNVFTDNTDGTSDTSLEAAEVTTTAADCWILICATVMDDAQDFGATWTNANLTGITVRDASFGHAAGNDGRLILVTGVKASAGATGTTTNTLTANSVKAMFTIALEPAVVAVVGPPFVRRRGPRQRGLLTRSVRSR